MMMMMMMMIVFVGCLQFLLENGGNVNAQRDDLYSPLHIAAEAGHVG